jgi:membrane-associated phospholipid phosphatase
LGYRAGIPTYIIASYVAMSRLHDNVHTASDVAFGATIGLIVGRTVTWHGRNFYASPMLIPKGGGVIVSVNAASSLSHTRH